ncbi:DNA-binding transcriptional regulator, MerR family [Desulfonatronum thiosulfatophilum]|uniref:DNA-binding transcriptional regulator, MerR family n=1 Tax=Desulfonatronum thiosulfatophilum TaxID=617002 RepID=A0A1G6CVN1_9BACT|nr:DNA-binding transcriptional regulator, MerR family [Desulfonatronum thiosulfatophilum]
MQPKLLRIGEAARVLGLEPYVLRFWEAEFPHLTPLRTVKGQRLYSQDDMNMLRKIQILLHEEGLTIDGARRRLDEGTQIRELTQDIIQELCEIREIIVGSSGSGRRREKTDQKTIDAGDGRQSISTDGCEVGEVISADP